MQYGIIIDGCMNTWEHYIYHKRCASSSIMHFALQTKIVQDIIIPSALKVQYLHLEFKQNKSNDKLSARYSQIDLKEYKYEYEYSTFNNEE